jgi:outer membrane immunogenic protein
MFGKETRLWLAASALGVLVQIEPTFAADIPVKAIAPAPAFIDWSGVYVGVHAGYGGGMTDRGSNTDYVARGFLGGGQIGINKQIASLVFGLELDGSWAGIKGSQNYTTGGPIIGFMRTDSQASTVDGLATFAGRAGLAADRWLVFAKGGIAGTHGKHSYVFSSTSVGPPALTLAGDRGGNDIRWAPMLGLGAEYALGGNWSIKGEYDFIHFGNRAVRLEGTLTTNGVAAPVAFKSQISQDAIHVVKVGANYRLGGVAIDPSYRPVPPARGHNWTGAYLGAQGAYGFGHAAMPGFLDPNSGKYDVDGWLGGVTGGVNVQSGVFVFGVEGEWMWSGLSGGKTLTNNVFVGVSQTTTLNTKVDWLAIASARAGFVVGDKLLLYSKGGVAIADQRHPVNHADSLTFPDPGSRLAISEARAVHTGVVGGVGAEYAIAGNWTAKVEYDYIKMIGQAYTATGTQFVNVPPTVGSYPFGSPYSKMSQDLHLFKFGVNYHFNPMPMVVSARY